MYKNKLAIVVFIIVCLCIVNVSIAEENWVKLPTTLPENAECYFDLYSIKYSGDIIENRGAATYYLVSIKYLNPTNPDTNGEEYLLFDTSDWTFRTIAKNGKKYKWQNVRVGSGIDYILKYVIDYTWNYKVRHGKCNDGCVQPTNFDNLIN